MPGSWYSQRIRSKRFRDIAAMASIAFPADSMRHSTIRKNVARESLLHGSSSMRRMLSTPSSLERFFMAILFPAHHDGGSSAPTGILDISSHPFVKTERSGVDGLNLGIRQKSR